MKNSLNIETIRTIKQQLLDVLNKDGFSCYSLVNIQGACSSWINENINSAPNHSFYHVYAIRDLCFSISNYIEGQEPMESTAHSTVEAALFEPLKLVISALDCENSDEKFDSLAVLVAAFEKLKH